MEKFTVLFHRFYEGFSGGHLKLNDYLSHVDSCSLYNSLIYVDPSSHPQHLWNRYPNLIDVYAPRSVDILFVAGLDWRALNDSPNIDNEKLIFNLIQGIRHADPLSELYTYLKRRAVRICVSQEVAEAIKATGQCNGPIHVIPNGINMSLLPAPQLKSVDVVVAGIKRPDLAKRISTNLQLLGLKVDCIVRHISRVEYLKRICRAQIAVALPYPSEGFYLPALEAMAMGVPLVCLDCQGNRSFCLDGITCLMPDSNSLLIENSVVRLIKDTELANRLSANAFTKSQFYNLERERHDFLKILNRYNIASTSNFI